MYIRSLKIENLRRLRDFSLDFTTAGGEPRKWTVLIGENGTGKSSILQAIALTAAGRLRVNDLAARGFSHLRDRRRSEAMNIRASFSFSAEALADAEIHPMFGPNPPPDLRLHSTVSLAAGETTLRADARYEPRPPNRPDAVDDPLDDARAKERRRWFVIGYGVSRALPDSGRVPDLTRPSVDRMKSLFDLTYPITSTSFISHYGSRTSKARAYSEVLRSALLDDGVLPADIEKLELRGYGGVSKATDLLERDRFYQRMGPEEVKIPAVALSHGYQSTIAWIADLVGHILLEADEKVAPKDFEGLVLIDELDLYLHPAWQARLIPALRKTFPNLQFVATTHSPVILAGLAPNEIVRLGIEPPGAEHAGSVVQLAPDVTTGEWEPIQPGIETGPLPDPRAMTGTEVYQEYFGLGLTLNEHGEAVRSYTAIATNPRRNDFQQGRLKELHAELTEALVRDLVAPVPRESP